MPRIKKNSRERPALEGGRPVRDTFLPFHRPFIDEVDIEGVVDTLRSGWLTLGPRTQAFENGLADYFGVKNVIAVSSCSEALIIALGAIGIGKGDEVITSPLTFASTVQAIVHLGAKPVLVDIERETLGIDPLEAEKKITSKTKALLPVHYGGQACRIGELLNLAGKSGIEIVEDAAHSFGASFQQKMVGSFGKATAFSFYATKNITTGEGGCIATDDDVIAEKARKLSFHGINRDAWSRYADRGSWYYKVELDGYKSNMNDIAASLGSTQLGKISYLLDRRKEIADQFIEKLSDCELFELPRIHTGNNHTWHLFVIQLNLEKLIIDRDTFIKALLAENIGSSVHFIPIYKHPFYRLHNDPGARYPVCENFFSRCVSLPIYPGMTTRDVEDVAGALLKLADFYSR